MSYAELQVTTHFSFLRGASSPEELFGAAASLGIMALGIADRNSLAGIVRAYEAAKVTGVRLIVGCRLDLEDAAPQTRRAPHYSVEMSRHNETARARVQPTISRYGGTYFELNLTIHLWRGQKPGTSDEWHRCDPDAHY